MQEQGLSGPRSKRVPMQMDHIVLNVENMEEMIAFYREVLELQPERLDAYRSGKAPFPSVRINEQTIIDLFPRDFWAKPGQHRVDPGNLNHFCLSTTKTAWDHLVERLRTHDVPVESGPVRRYGARGTGISVYLRDPDGNQIELRYYAEGDAGDYPSLGS